MKKALGKGLSALIPDTYVKEKQPETPSISQKSTPAQEAAEGFSLIPVHDIVENTDQPRKEFIQEKIDELAASIQENGILQPVVVTKKEGGKFMLVCGERRWRASQKCGLDKIPAIVKEAAGNELLEWALIENVQRQDLNPLEEAEAYRRLADERLISHEEMAKKLGKSRTAITNTLRLLKLPEEIQQLVVDERLSEGHARALLGLMSPAHQRQMAKRIIEENLSVRQVELLVQRSQSRGKKPKKARPLTPEILDLEEKMMKHFGAQVKIYPRKNQKQGRIELYYYSLDELDGILDKAGIPRS